MQPDADVERQPVDHRVAPVRRQVGAGGDDVLLPGRGLRRQQGVAGQAERRGEPARCESAVAESLSPRIVGVVVHPGVVRLIGVGTRPGGRVAGPLPAAISGLKKR